MQNTVKLILQHAVLLVCKLQYLFCHKTKFTSFCKLVLFLSQNTVLLILQSTVFLIFENTVLLISQKNNFTCFINCSSFFMLQNIVRIPVEDWHLIYTTFHKVRSTYLSSDGMNE